MEKNDFDLGPSAGPGGLGADGRGVRRGAGGVAGAGVVARASRRGRGPGELERGTPLDLAATFLREGLDALGEVVGAVTTDDLLDRIFGEFCVGK